MRAKGTSIITIAKDLRVSKSSVSAWCKDIELTPEQVNNLEASKIFAGISGRMKGAAILKQRRLDQVQAFKTQRMKDICSLSKQELLIAGVALYWGEGSKYIDSRFGFGNSDPVLIKFIINWLRICFDIPMSDIYFRVAINNIYEQDIDEILNFWYKITGTGPVQFRKTTFIQAQNKKIYAHRDTYNGVLHVRVRNSSRLQRKILGLLVGLANAKMDTK